MVPRPITFTENNSEAAVMSGLAAPQYRTSRCYDSIQRLGGLSGESVACVTSAIHGLQNVQHRVDLLNLGHASRSSTIAWLEQVDTRSTGSAAIKVSRVSRLRREQRTASERPPVRGSAQTFAPRQYRGVQGLTIFADFLGLQVWRREP